ncbi:type II toxin-antitoxin system RelE/ParE family toxin [Prosthecodimorpha staleyi]|uniref:Type II toxin-antitoxin system RelE/ParE family toxin n=1 Tax=Prosthecodimorpha staleyi TaxID=2840188 RepID=A0A947GD95_9HYPH|nr:type II toxin-antitoxin system RelE/ParE family toxin [Prosthecodimorpha staleyi]MBT9290046.1 type II toxin-antitoxin system RelE/ParE family toxin [Prosthecodimorpha staleyi]
MAFRLTPQAETDIEAVVLFIAQDNAAAALRWYDEILRHCRNLGDMPGLGIARPDIRPELRTFPAGRYLILYRVAGQDAEIVRVVHGARQWQDLLDP